jgi:hypothetical protein
VIAFSGSPGTVAACAAYQQDRDARSRANRLHSCLIFAPERRATVKPGAILLISLFDGELVLDDPTEFRARLTMLGFARIPRQTVSVGPFSASSERAAVMRVAPAGTGGMIQVRLRLPAMHERRCTSCRTLHYFYSVTEP